jgi:1-acyl-sn-glycerol-3-phosphate acyltransferase
MLRSLWALFVLTVSGGILGAYAIVGSMIRPGGHTAMRAGRMWSRVMLGAAGIGVSYDGLDDAYRHHPCVYMANHVSMIDPFALAPALPLSTLYVSKKSLFRIPFIGWGMTAGGFIPIDRSDRAKAIESLDSAAERIRSGRALILFVEGTRSRDGKLGAFKKGPFHLALRAGVPVVPVAISGSRALCPPGSFFLHSGDIRVRFAPPIDLTPFGPDDLPDLMARVREAMLERLGASEGGNAIPADPSRSS